MLGAYAKGKMLDLLFYSLTQSAGKAEVAVGKGLTLACSAGIHTGRKLSWYVFLLQGCSISASTWSFP